MTIRGITNVSGTACHLSSALILFCHCIVPLRTALVAVTEKNQSDPSDESASDSSWLLELGRFLHELSRDDSDDPVDPTRFYRSVRRHLGIEAHELGDAVTALSKLLSSLQNKRHGEEINALFDSLLQLTTHGGRVHSVISANTSTRRRTKQTRVRPMTCPWSLMTPSDSSDASVPEDMKAMLEEQPLKGYQWMEGTYSEEVMAGNNTDEGGCYTTKRLVLDAVPNIWLMHLPQTGTVRVRVSARFNVPALDNGSYSLVGGLLHVIDTDEDEAEIDDEGEASGHNVAIVQKDHEWFLVNDADVTSLTLETVLQLLSGDSDASVPGCSCPRGMLLVYQRQDNTNGEEVNVNIQQAIEKLQDAELPQSTKSDNNGDAGSENLVGRRLRVKWSKGKWYSGTIKSYNRETQQHQMVYDDGDVRSYHLDRKTIEWEDPEEQEHLS